MKKLFFFSIISLFFVLFSCKSKDEKRYETLWNEASEISERIRLNNDASTEDCKNLLNISKEIVSLNIDETNKAPIYFYLAWHDPQDGNQVKKPDYTYLERAAINGHPLARIEMARKYLDEGRNDKAYQILQNPDSIAYMNMGDDVTGVLYYEGATGFPKDINKACDRLALGTINSTAQVDSDCIYPNFEKRRQLYAGNLNLIKYIDKKNIRINFREYYIPQPQGPDYSALRSALQHYESARKLGSDFPLLDDLIGTLSTFVNTYDYYKENGEDRDGKYYLRENNNYWRDGGVRQILGSTAEGIYIKNKYVHNTSEVDSTGYMIRDAGNPSVKALDVKRFDNDFELFVGDIKYYYHFGSESEVGRFGIKFNSSGKITPEHWEGKIVR